MPLLSVVIPVYKAEGCLNELYNRLTSSLETLTPDFEIILVEDCGGDRSWDIIQNLARQDERVKGIQFSRNFGQHYGITAGIDHASGDWIVVMDCDLQDRPEDIPRLYQKTREGYDVVRACRMERKDSIFKKVTSWSFYKVFNYLTDTHYDSNSGTFRMISRKVADNYRLLREQLQFFGGLVDWMGFPTATIDVCREERFKGKSTYSIRKLWKLATEIIIAYSDKPLRMSVKFGFFMCLFSFLYGSYIIYRAVVFGTPVLGWSSVIVFLNFIGGIIIGLLGVIGIYLGKTYDGVKNRPLYIIRTTENI